MDRVVVGPSLVGQVVINFLYMFFSGGFLFLRQPIFFVVVVGGFY